MLTHEADSTNLLFRTLTEVRSSFSPPIPREDLYTLARKLTNAVEKLTSAAHVLSLHSIDGFATHITSILDIIQRQAVLTAAVIPKLADIRGLDNYWMDMLRISPPGAAHRRRIRRVHCRTLHPPNGTAATPPSWRS